MFSADSQGRLDPRILDYLYAAHPNWRIVPETEEVSMIEHEADYVGEMSERKSVKSYISTLLLALFLGYVGAHRFYAGKVGTGILFFLSLGFFGIGWFIDVFTVAFGNFTDKTGQFIRPKGNS